MRSRSAAAAAASSARVFTPSVSAGSGATCATTRSPAADEVADGVGQVELALRVVRLEPVERGPERRRRGRRRSRSCTRAARAARASRRRPRRSPRRCRRPRGRSGRRRGRRRARTRGRSRRPASRRCVSTSCVEQLGREERRVARRGRAGVSALVAERGARRADRVAGAERLLLDRDLTSRRTRRGCPARRRRRAAPGRAAGRPRAPSRPSAGRGAGAGAWARPSACACRARRPSRRLRVSSRSRVGERWLGRQDSNLGSRDQNPLPYHLATPQGSGPTC